jgi:exportin-T
MLSDSLLETLIAQMSSDILVIKAELPKKDEDSEIVESSSTFDSQLYLFETAGLLISLVDNTKLALKLKLLDLLLNPIYANLQQIISNSKRDPQSILQAHHSLMAIGTIARGFEYDSSPNKKYPTEIAERFNNTAEVVLVTLENLSNFEIIRDSSRFSFARFIPILKNSINNHLSRLISILLASNNLKLSELTDFLGFIGQIVHSFNKDDLIYQLLNDLFTPLSNKVSAMLNDKGENEVFELMPDVQRDKASLKKAFITLLISLNTNHVSSLLITQTNKGNLPATLNNLLEDANNLNDLSVTKLALGELVILAKVFGNDTCNDPEDRYGQNLTIEGISSFLLSNLVKLSFQIPFQNEKFDIKDAQFRFIADELASILKTLYSVKGQELISYLRDVYFPEIQLPSNVGDDLCSNLVTLDIKEFRKYFVKFVLQFK